jgi:1-acyl-sn-glycerol-3-phosphate acyltransferase
MVHYSTVGKIVLFLKSTLFWVLSFTTVLLYNAMIPLFFLLTPLARHKAITSVAMCFNFLLRYIVNVRYRAHGIEHLPSQPAIIACNHQSIWETLILNCILPPFSIIMKREILWIPFFGWGTLLATPIAINRKSGKESLVQVIEQGKRRLAAGLCICVFPEGTRLLPKTRKRYKYGVAKMALALNAAIVPVAHNAGYCIPRRSFLIFPGIVDIHICPSISSTGKDVVQLTEQLEHTINTKLDEIGA